MIAELLSASRHTRRHAFDRLIASDETAYAARDVLAFDPDATVRARAAFFLGKAPPSIAAPALRDATYDEMPMVRHAAVRALAMRDDVASLPRLARIAAEDPTWWVRRAAIVSAVSLARADAIPMLRDALEDPFWRVRHAAVRALLVLGADDADALMQRVGPATSERSYGALAYLQKRLGTNARDLIGPTEVPNAIVARMNPDPAVVTARVEAGLQVSPAFLVECLGDPHEALRITAKKRLERDPDARALELSLLWLEDPRIPHAAETVIELLDGLDLAHVEPLLDHALGGELVGGACWAVSYVGLTEDRSRLGHVLRLARSTHVQLRRACVAALAGFDDASAIVVLREALLDEDDDVVRLAAHALLGQRDPEATAALRALPFGRDVLLRRVLVSVADDEKLRVAINDDDPVVRSAAVRMLASRGALSEAERDRLSIDADPWVRSAVLDDARAAHVLERDPQPSLRREAFSRVSDRRQAGLLASASDDPWLRARAAASLDPRRDDDLGTLLRLARDPNRAVRAAAADALERAPDLDTLLDRALVRETADDVRIAALAQRSRAFDDEAFARLRALRGSESDAVRAWIDDVLTPSKPAVVESRTASRATHPTRPLGHTGLQVSSLVLSGVGNLDAGAYVEAMHAGCNSFFWEPRYHTLGRALRTMREAQVIAGTYHASERAIVSDVERSLRRLRREALDVFLLFWVRSPERVSEETFLVLSRLKAQGLVRAFGFSTHDRALAYDAISARPWDVVMTRHSAAHPGAEERLLPHAHASGTGVLGFSATSYGRVLSETISAPDAYRYSLSQTGMSACVSAPRNERELRENLFVLGDATMSLARQEELRAHGRTVREESRDFNHTIRKHPLTLADATPRALEQWLDHEDVPRHDFE